MPTIQPIQKLDQTDKYILTNALKAWLATTEWSPPVTPEGKAYLCKAEELSVTLAGMDIYLSPPDLKSE